MNNGEQKAFPLEYGTSDGKVYQKGLTKREYFAGLAIQGIIAGFYGNNSARGTYGQLAEEAVEAADALLAELDKTNPINE